MIGCLCVTENRAPCFPIALHSFMTQSPCRTLLLVVTPSIEAYEAEVVRAGLVGRVCWLPHKGTFLERLTAGTEALFRRGCSAVAVWDDDDWSPPDRLERTRKALTRAPLCSYEHGWFVNLRTLHGAHVVTAPYLWGGTIAFTRAVWDAVGPWGPPVPGQDRAFVNRWQRPYDERPVARIAPARPDCWPIAFSHGKNVSTWLKGHHEYMGDLLKAWLPDKVFEAVRAMQNLLIERREYPPQPPMEEE